MPRPFCANSVQEAHCLGSRPSGKKEVDPLGENEVAIASIAALYLNQKKWDEAQQWNEKLVAINPNNADAYYSLGFIAWSKWYPAYGTARANQRRRSTSNAGEPCAGSS